MPVKGVGHVDGIVFSPAPGNGDDLDVHVCQRLGDNNVTRVCMNWFQRGKKRDYMVGDGRAARTGLRHK